MSNRETITMTNRERSLLYLRNQTYWLSRMADQLEQGETVDCEWAVDLDFPSYVKEELEENELLKPVREKTLLLLGINDEKVYR